MINITERKDEWIDEWEIYIYLLDGGILSSIQQNKLKTTYQKIMNPEIQPVLRKLQNGRYYDIQGVPINMGIKWGRLYCLCSNGDYFVNIILYYHS